jgi:Phage tail tube protein, GTA-gp10
MGNPHRAEASVELAGTRYVLRLTLQALAEIEAAFAVQGLDALGARLSGANLGTRDLLVLLAALVRGGGAQIAEADLARRIEARDLPALVEAIGAVFAASFAGEPPADPR